MAEPMKVLQKVSIPAEKRTDRISEHWMDGYEFQKTPKFARPFDDCIPASELSEANLPPFYVRLRDDQVGHLANWVGTTGLLAVYFLNEKWPWDFEKGGDIRPGRESWGPAYSGPGRYQAKNGGPLKGGPPTPAYARPSFAPTNVSSGKHMVLTDYWRCLRNGVKRPHGDNGAENDQEPLPKKGKFEIEFEDKNVEHVVNTTLAQYRAFYDGFHEKDKKIASLTNKDRNGSKMLVEMRSRIAELENSTTEHENELRKKTAAEQMLKTAYSEKDSKIQELEQLNVKYVNIVFAKEQNLKAVQDANTRRKQCQLLINDKDTLEKMANEHKQQLQAMTKQYKVVNKEVLELRQQLQAARETISTHEKIIAGFHDEAEELVSHLKQKQYKVLEEEVSNLRQQLQAAQETISTHEKTIADLDDEAKDFVNHQEQTWKAIHVDREKMRGLRKELEECREYISNPRHGVSARGQELKDILEDVHVAIDGQEHVLSNTFAVLDQEKGTVLIECSIKEESSAKKECSTKKEGSTKKQCPIKDIAPTQRVKEEPDSKAIDVVTDATAPATEMPIDDEKDISTIPPTDRAIGVKNGAQPANEVENTSASGAQA